MSAAKSLSNLTPLELKGGRMPPSLVVAKPTITVRQALKIMATHNITSLPIQSHDSDAIVNIVNLIDILSYTIKESVADEEHPSKLDSEGVKGLDNGIESVMTLDTETESYRIFKSDARDELRGTVKAFTQGIHRSLVIDYTNEIPPYILTQTDIIRYVCAHPESLPGIDFDKTVRDFGLIREGREVVVGKPEETALNVYRRMAEKGLMGIAITDSDNKLIANLSAADLHGLTYRSIDCLILPVCEFLQALPNPGSALTPFTANPDTPLRNVLQTIVEQHIHRVWIVENERVIDVVTLSDLIKIFVDV
ncbi:10131_t:CDS:2 [Paraglomus brasilianum]|uniref:10131_t:CDS:1 n=1 Tax=Paraglomus brasilianum TaxID=144538 RepID=A0A9N9B767_9GLOM|nr:10131_t:CDS:2 [Paraglomus brasilianum]